MENAEEIMHSLEEFAKFKPKDIPKELDEYLGYVAKTGDPVFKWSIIKCLFREKLVNVITDFYESTLAIELPPCPNVDVFNYERMKANLLERIDSFHGAPFTVQRISELLTNPRKEYNRADKFMRAIEKNILVVSTREPGRFAEVDGDSQGEASFNGIPCNRDPLYEAFCNYVGDPNPSSPTTDESKTETKNHNPENDEKNLENSTPKEDKDEKEEKTLSPKSEKEPEKKPEEFLAESALLGIDEAIKEITTTSEKEPEENKNEVKTEDKHIDLECKELQFSPEPPLPEQVECDTSNPELEANPPVEEKTEQIKEASESQVKTENEVIAKSETSTENDASENEVTSCDSPQTTEPSADSTDSEKQEEEESPLDNSTLNTTSDEPQPMEVEESPTTTSESEKPDNEW